MSESLCVKCERTISPTDRERLDEFKQFLRIRSVSSEGPYGAYKEAVTFLDALAVKAGLQTQVLEFAPGKPVLLATWLGSSPELGSVLLNSHYDVVPVDEAHWKYDPFSAHEDEAGNIFARGTQDMKCVCMMYLHAIAQLSSTGFRPRRTIHLSFVPDEEIGGTDGMCAFLESETFQSLGVEVAFDEGLANPTESFTVFYGERAAIWATATMEGNTGHASRFIENTAMGKLTRFLVAVDKFREEQRSQLGNAGCSHAVAKKLADVVSVNVTMVEGGQVTTLHDGTRKHALNVVPSTCTAGFDMRIPPTVSIEEMKEKINSWTAEDGVSWKLAEDEPKHAVTSLECSWWALLQEALKSQGHSIEAEIFPAATDSRFLRQRQIPAFGFSPLNRTPILLHDHNEMINAEVYLDGIDVYVKLLPSIVNADKQ